MSKSNRTTNGNAKGPEIVEMADLRKRLEEAEETIRAITQGEVDAVIVNTPEGNKVYTLEGADKPYRIMVEQMNEGAVSLGSDWQILYSNHTFANLLKTPLEKISGQPFENYVLPLDRSSFQTMMYEASGEPVRGRISINADDGTIVPIRLSISKVRIGDVDYYHLILTDISEIAQAEETLQKMYDELEVMVRERTSSLARSNDLLKAEVIERVISQRQLAEEKEKIATLLTSFNEGMIVTDDAGKIVLMNRAAEALTGWRERDGIGSPLDDIFSVMPVEGRKEHVGDLIIKQGGKPDLRCVSLGTKGGTALKVEYAGMALKDTDPQSQSFVLLFQKRRT